MHYLFGFCLAFMICKVVLVRYQYGRLLKKSEKETDSLIWVPNKTFFRAVRPLNRSTIIKYLVAYIAIFFIVLPVTYIFQEQYTAIVAILMIATFFLHFMCFYVENTTPPHYNICASGVWFIRPMYQSFMLKRFIFVPWDKVSTYTQIDNHHVNIYTTNNQNIDLIISGGGIDQVMNHIQYYHQNNHNHSIFR